MGLVETINVGPVAVRELTQSQPARVLVKCQLVDGSNQGGVDQCLKQLLVFI